MRLATRAFALCFIPSALILAITFTSLHSVVQRRFQEELRTGLQDKQIAFERMRAGDRLRLSRMLRIAGENAALKAGLQQLNADPESPEARAKVEDRLRELSRQIGFGMFSVENLKGVPIAWVVREGDRFEATGTAPPSILQGVSEYRGQLYQLVSAPIGENHEGGGYISAGDGFDLADFQLPVVLTKAGRIVSTNLTGADGQSLAASAAACGAVPECDLRVENRAYLSLRLQEGELGNGYVLRSLENADAMADILQSLVCRVFLATSIGAVLVAFAISRGASRSMMRPVHALLSHFRKSESAGLLMELPPGDSPIVEVRELMDGFNRAASAIQDARTGLQQVYVEFAGSLAHALDARDGYTANHSQRVSQIATFIAQAIDLSAEDQEAIRIGALLHDIGKIGIPDYILQKTGVLTDGEFVLIRQHPTIGCRILEGVRGFTPYLPVVELHHENWDGTGYPYGLRCKDIPLAARIVHVADAWDAMTSDRPYRRGFTRRHALEVIQLNAGTQFDPEIADVFSRIMQCEGSGDSESMVRLSAALGESQPAATAESPSPL